MMGLLAVVAARLSSLLERDWMAERTVERSCELGGSSNGMSPA